MLVLHPFSKEQARYDYLKRSLAVYRLAFGQPRQEDLVAYLLSQQTDAEIIALKALPRINLQP